MYGQQTFPKVLVEVKVLARAATDRAQRRSETLAEDLERLALAERGVRALERQRELARRQGLARYD